MVRIKPSKIKLTDLSVAMYKVAKTKTINQLGSNAAKYIHQSEKGWKEAGPIQGGPVILGRIAGFRVASEARLLLALRTIGALEQNL